MQQTSNYKKNTTANPIPRFFLNNFYTVLLDEVRKLKPKSILDVGCGEGFTLNKIKQANICKKLYGIEFLDVAIALGKKIHPTIPIRKADIYKIPYKDNSFDLVICTEVLEHLEDPEKALLELKRVSSKYLILSVPNEPLFTIQRILRGKNVLKLGNHPEHIQHWSANNFKKFIKRHLKVIDDKTPLPWTMVTAEK
jgi:ubiquinone/menaquinone biosynthesis C-methylase UbiE